MSLSLQELRAGSDPIVEVEVPLLQDTIMVRVLRESHRRRIYPDAEDSVGRLHELLKATLTDEDGAVLTDEQATEMVADIESEQPSAVFNQIVAAVVSAQRGTAGGLGNG